MVQGSKSTSSAVFVPCLPDLPEDEVVGCPHGIPFPSSDGATGSTVGEETDYEQDLKALVEALKLKEATARANHEAAEEDLKALMQSQDHETLFHQAIAEDRRELRELRKHVMAEGAANLHRHLVLLKSVNSLEAHISKVGSAEKFETRIKMLEDTGQKTRSVSEERICALEAAHAGRLECIEERMEALDSGANSLQVVIAERCSACEAALAKVVRDFLATLHDSATLAARAAPTPREDASGDLPLRCNSRADTMPGTPRGPADVAMAEMQHQSRESPPGVESPQPGLQARVEARVAARVGTRMECKSPSTVPVARMASGASSPLRSSDALGPGARGAPVSRNGSCRAAPSIFRLSSSPPSAGNLPARAQAVRRGRESSPSMPAPRGFDLQL